MKTLLQTSYSLHATRSVTCPTLPPDVLAASNWSIGTDNATNTRQHLKSSTAHAQLPFHPHAAAATAPLRLKVLEARTSAANPCKKFDELTSSKQASIGPKPSPHATHVRITPTTASVRLLHRTNKEKGSKPTAPSFLSCISITYCFPSGIFHSERLLEFCAHCRYTAKLQPTLFFAIYISRTRL